MTVPRLTSLQSAKLTLAVGLIAAAAMLIWGLAAGSGKICFLAFWVCGLPIAFAVVEVRRELRPERQFFDVLRGGGIDPDGTDL